LVITIIGYGYFSLKDSNAVEIEESPERIISKITGEILEEVKNDPDLAAGDWTKINKLVDTKVMPVIDFEKMTSLAVGRHWRSASSDEQAKLMKSFRKLLLLTYSGAIRFADKADMKILPPRRSTSDVDVVVRTRVTVPGRQAVPIDYRLRKTDTGWRIFDLNVLGLWLIENYRAQFSQIVNRNGIAGLINAIDTKNKSLSQSKK
jgi:phospholipid transport system substrate-binding protein